MIVLTLIFYVLNTFLSNTTLPYCNCTLSLRTFLAFAHPLTPSTSVPSYARLWVHENRRVFADRLINDQDREWFDALLARLMESHLKLQMPEVIAEGQRVLFGDFMSGGGDQRQYEEIPDAQAVMRTINDFLSDYNEQVCGGGCQLMEIPRRNEWSIVVSPMFMTLIVILIVILHSDSDSPFCIRMSDTRLDPYI